MLAIGEQMDATGAEAIAALAVGYEVCVRTGMAAYDRALGVFEAANFPAALKAIAEWCTRVQRATAVGLISAGPGLGAVLAQPIVAGLILAGVLRSSSSA